MGNRNNTHKSTENHNIFTRNMVHTDREIDEQTNRGHKHFSSILKSFTNSVELEVLTLFNICCVVMVKQLLR